MLVYSSLIMREPVLKKTRSPNIGTIFIYQNVSVLYLAFLHVRKEIFGNKFFRGIIIFAQTNNILCPNAGNSNNKGSIDSTLGARPRFKATVDIA